VGMHSFSFKLAPSPQLYIAAPGLGKGECSIRRIFWGVHYDTVYDIYFIFTLFRWFNSVYYASFSLELIVDPDIKQVFLFVAKENSMKLIIRCVIPLQVRARAGVNLDVAYAQRMSFSISTTQPIAIST